MTIPTEQQVLVDMGIDGLPRGINAVCELLIALNYVGVARELKTRAEGAELDWDGFDE